MFYLKISPLLFFTLFSILFVRNNCASELFEDDLCCNKEGNTGVCKALSNCENVLIQISQGFYPIFCNPDSEENFNALVCCISVKSRQNNNNVNDDDERISAIKCKEYFPNDEDTFQIEAVGGVKAKPQTFKHMALVGIKSDEELLWFCGGALISEKFILTAAHCIENRIGIPNIVRLGELDIASKDELAEPKDFQISRYFIHPAYETPSLYHDIGLLELKEIVGFSTFIQPACLYQSNEISEDFAIATGWGATSFLGKNSSHLIQVELNFVNRTLCNRFFKNLPKKQLYQGIAEEFQICAGGNDGKDTCQGDSGGPLQIKNAKSTRKNNLFYHIIGITSFGIGCGLENAPGVYTKVYYYLDWIERIVWKI